MKYLFLLLILSTLVTSCVSEDRNKSQGTYFGGQIINPVLGYVILRQGEEVTDSIPLDRRNRFLHKFENFKGGLYRVEHGEHQMIYIEEGDSILLRVNTKDFDESLSFSGYGSEKSSFLLDMYAHWEAENETIKKKYQKNPKNFKKSLDSMEINHKEELNNFLLDKDYSDNFIEIANAATTLDNYQRKEWYPFAHYGKDKLAFIDNLPDDFYDYRNSLSLNNPNLEDLYSFRRYLSSYINHLTYLRYGDTEAYNRTSYTHNHHRIAVIDSVITNKNLKERLLRQMSRIFIANSNNLNEVNMLFDEIKNVSTSEKTISSINTLYDNNKFMQAGNMIPDVMLINPESGLKTLSSRINKPTVLYFWSYLRMSHMDNSHKKATDLQKKYPEFNFIAINVNSEQDKWLLHLEKNNFDPMREYRLSKPDQAKKQLVLNDINKTIVIDKDGKILNSHANLHNSNFENELLAYLNQ